MTDLNRYAQLPEVAERLGLSVPYLRRVVAAKASGQSRKYPATVLASVPPMEKAGKSYRIWLPRFIEWAEKRN